jgi:hypothetical protein
MRSREILGTAIMERAERSNSETEACRKDAPLGRVESLVVFRRKAVVRALYSQRDRPKPRAVTRR